MKKSIRFLILIMMFCLFTPIQVGVLANNVKAENNFLIKTLAYNNENTSGKDDSGLWGPYSDSDENSSNTYWIKILVDDGTGKMVEYTPSNYENIKLKDGVDVQITINWQLHDATRNFELNLGDLGRLGNFDISDTIRNEGSPYIISFRENEDGTITVIVNYDEGFELETGRNVSIEFKGKLDLDPRNDNEEEDNKFKIGSTTIPYEPTYEESGLNVEKTYGNLEIDENGDFYLNYKVINTVDGKVTDPIFYDDLPKGAELIEESVKVEFIPRDEEFTYPFPGKPDTENSWELNTKVNGHSFSISATKGTTLYTGDVVTYTYKVKLSKELIKQILTTQNQIVNTAYAECNENGKGKSTCAYPGSNFRKPRLEKTGSAEELTEGNSITWTITWDPQGLGNILEQALGTESINNANGDVLKALVEHLNLNIQTTEGKEKAEAVFDSLFGENAHLITDQILGDNHTFENNENKKQFSVFDMTYDNESGKYIYTLTSIINGEVGKQGFQNTGEGAGANKVTGKVEPNYSFNYIKNYISNNDTDKFEQTWEIAVTNPNFRDLLNNSFINMSFEDTLPIGTSYVEGSAIITLTKNSDKELPNWITEENLNEFIDLINESQYSQLSFRPQNNGKIDITFNVPTNFMNLWKNDFVNYTFQYGEEKHSVEEFLKADDWNFTIRYNTRVTDANSFKELLGESSLDSIGGNKRITFTNTVKGNLNNIEGPERDASTTTTFRQALQKKNKYKEMPTSNDTDYKFSKQPVEQFLNNTGNGYQSIYFEIIVNQDKLTFTNDGRLILIDEMGVDLSIIPYSVQVIEVRGSSNSDELIQVGNPLTEGNIDEKGFTYSIDSINNRITFNVPDSKYLVISYWANVLDNGNGIFEASNSVEIYGWETASREKSESPSEPLKPSVSESSDSVGFSVYKFGKNEIGQDIPLDGAEFKLEQLTYHPENKEEGKEVFQLDTSSEKSIWEGTQRTYGENKIIGIFDFTNLPKGAIYRLTETQVPDKYIGIDPIYFIFDNYDENIGFTNNTVSSDELLDLEDYNIQVISYYQIVNIENRIKSASVSFEGNKEIDGREWDGSIDNNAYKFTLEALEGAPMPQEAEGNNKYEVSNKGHSIVFPQITYTSEGIYRYEITENSEKNGVSDLVKNTKTDQTIYTVTVEVIEEQDNLYVKSINYSKSSGAVINTNYFEFVNTYVEADKGNLNLTKKVVGSAPGSRAKEYTFILSGSNNLAGKTYKVDGAKENEIEFVFSNALKATATLTITGNNTATIYGLDLDEYIIIEDETNTNIDGYEWNASYSTEGGKVKILPGQSANFTVTNTYTQKSGNLKIQKNIEGIEINEDLQNKVFSFTIVGPEEVAGQSYPLSTGGSITFSNDTEHTGSITIKGTGNVIIQNLPLGIYNIIENQETAEIEGYVLNKVEITENGNVKLDDQNLNKAIEVTNTYVEDSNNNEDVLGSLTITKQVEGIDELKEDHYFSFDIIGPDDVKNKAYNVYLDDQQIDTINFNEESQGRVSIQGRGTIIIKNLPLGSYTITEDKEDAELTGYTLEVTGEDQVELTSDNLGDSITITNRYTAELNLGSLTLTKVIEGLGELPIDHEFSFDIIGPDEVKNKAYQVYSADENELEPIKFDETGLGTVSIQGSGTIIIKNLPLGSYTITEDKEDAELTGYTLEVTGEGQVKLTSENLSGSITVSNSYTEESNETETNLGSLTLTKVIEGLGELPIDHEFSFDIIGPDEVKNKAYQVYSADENELESIKFDETGLGTVSIQGSGTIIIKNLPLGSYTITEDRDKVSIDGLTFIEATEEGDSILSSENRNKKVTITNLYELSDEFPETPSDNNEGSLTISKKINGLNLNDSLLDKVFTFTITGPSDVANKTFYDLDGKEIITFNNDLSGTIVIKGQGSVAIQKLPYGTYTVTENSDSAEIEGYNWEIEISEEGSAVLEKSNSDQSITVTNKYTKKENPEVPEEPNDSEEVIGSLILNKIVKGSVSKEIINNMVYSFVIEGPNDVIDKVYQVTSNTDQKTIKFDKDGKGTIQVKGNGAVQINGLPLGTYTISEDITSAQIPSYKLEVTGDKTVKLNKESSVKTADVINNYTEEKAPDMPEEPDEFVEPILGSLILNKLIKGNAPKTTTNSMIFTFEIEGPDSVAGNSYKLSNGETLKFDNNSKASIDINGAGLVKITDLPLGTYAIAESNEGVQIDNYNWDVTYSVEDNKVTLTEDSNNQSISVTNTYTLDEQETDDPEKPSIEISKEQSVLRNNNQGYTQEYNGQRTNSYIEVKVNDIVTYYLTVTNTGNETIKNVIITDSVPEGLVIIDNSATHAEDLVIKGNLLTWKISELKTKEAVSVEVQFRIVASENNDKVNWKNIAYVDFENNLDGPISSNEVEIGTSSNQSTETDSPSTGNNSTSTDSPSSTNGSNTNGTNTNASSTVPSYTSTTTGANRTNAGSNTTSVSTTSPKTGVSEGLSLIIAITSIGGASFVSFVNRKRNRKNK